jgi:hypothetical protein
MKRGHGNPNWVSLPHSLPAVLPEFEVQVERLGLTQAEFVDSAQLRHWCARNRNRYYVPEWLLEAWGLAVEAIFTGVA